MRVRQSLFINTLLVLALVLAQAGAIVHALGHADTRNEGTARHAGLCGDCLSFSNVLSVAGGGTSGSLPAGPRHAVPVFPAARQLVQQRAPSEVRSRGPPILR